jgi:hypothetical protein
MVYINYRLELVTIQRFSFYQETLLSTVLAKKVFVGTLDMMSTTQSYYIIAIILPATPKQGTYSC